MKTNYLVVYDYGSGGVRGSVRARTKKEILEKYPDLTVSDSRPSWMTDQDFSGLPAADIDDPPSGWLKKMK